MSAVDMSSSESAARMQKRKSRRLSKPRTNSSNNGTLKSRLSLGNLDNLTRSTANSVADLLSPSSEKSASRRVHDLPEQQNAAEAAYEEEEQARDDSIEDQTEHTLKPGRLQRAGTKLARHLDMSRQSAKSTSNLLLDQTAQPPEDYAWLKEKAQRDLQAMREHQTNQSDGDALPKALPYRRKSLLTPGLATRGNDVLRKLAAASSVHTKVVDAEVQERYYNPHLSPVSPLARIAGLDIPGPQTSRGSVRTATPAELDYGRIGGSLHIANGRAASPSSLLAGRTDLVLHAQGGRSKIPRWPLVDDRDGHATEQNVADGVRVVEPDAFDRYAVDAGNPWTTEDVGLEDNTTIAISQDVGSREKPLPPEPGYPPYYLNPDDIDNAVPIAVGPNDEAAGQHVRSGSGSSPTDHIRSARQAAPVSVEDARFGQVIQYDDTPPILQGPRLSAPTPQHRPTTSDATLRNTRLEMARVLETMMAASRFSPMPQRREQREKSASSDEPQSARSDRPSLTWSESSGSSTSQTSSNPSRLNQTSHARLMSHDRRFPGFSSFSDPPGAHSRTSSQEVHQISETKTTIEAQSTGGGLTESWSKAAVAATPQSDAFPLEPVTVLPATGLEQDLETAHHRALPTTPSSTPSSPAKTKPKTMAKKLQKKAPRPKSMPVPGPVPVPLDRIVVAGQQHGSPSSTSTSTSGNSSNKNNNATSAVNNGPAIIPAVPADMSARVAQRWVSRPVEDREPTLPVLAQHETTKRHGAPPDNDYFSQSQSRKGGHAPQFSPNAPPVPERSAARPRAEQVGDADLTNVSSSDLGSSSAISPSQGSSEPLRRKAVPLPQQTQYDGSRNNLNLLRAPAVTSPGAASSVYSQSQNLYPLSSPGSAASMSRPQTAGANVTSDDEDAPIDWAEARRAWAARRQDAGDGLRMRMEKAREDVEAQGSLFAATRASWQPEAFQRAVQRTRPSHDNGIDMSRQFPTGAADGRVPSDPYDKRRSLNFHLPMPRQQPFPASGQSPLSQPSAAPSPLKPATQASTPGSWAPRAEARRERNTRAADSSYDVTTPASANGVASYFPTDMQPASNGAKLEGNSNAVEDDQPSTTANTNVAARSLQMTRPQNVANAQRQKRTTPPTAGRYDGGFAFGFEPGKGIGGSAGTRTVAGQSASRKAGAGNLAQGFGVDLSDIPIFLAKKS